MAVSFAQEEQEKIISCYRGMVDELYTTSTGFIEKVTDVCAAASYKPILDFTNECIALFNDELLPGIRNSITEWRDGDGCLSAYIETMDGGEEAFETAQSMENALEDAFNEFASLEEFSVDTSNPEHDPKHYSNLKDAFNDYKKAVDDIEGDVTAQISTGADENSAYNTLNGIVAGTLSGITAALEVIETKIDELEDRYGEKEMTGNEDARAAADEIKSSAVNWAEEAASSIGGEL